MSSAEPPTPPACLTPACLQEGIATLSSFERYKSELLAGQLSWAPMHESGGWLLRLLMALIWLWSAAGCIVLLGGLLHKLGAGRLGWGWVLDGVVPAQLARPKAAPPLHPEPASHPLYLTPAPHQQCLLQMPSGGRTRRSWLRTTASCCACC